MITHHDQLGFTPRLQDGVIINNIPFQYFKTIKEKILSDK